MGVLGWLLSGLIIGAIARFLVRGPHHLGCIGTIGLGMIGSLVGGTALNALGGNGLELSGSGFFGSVFGAVLVLVLARLFSGRANDRRRDRTYR
ncbi:MAG: GlsB/YeaQ/YmgE family stress response membrane protein [Acidimicrobiales bacterium]